MVGGLIMGQRFFRGTAVGEEQKHRPAAVMLSTLRHLESHWLPCQGLLGKSLTGWLLSLWAVSNKIKNIMEITILSLHSLKIATATKETLKPKRRL